MSLTGSAENNHVLRGKINRLDELRGYSAYELALIHGFKGTEEEWLEILGNNGYAKGVEKNLNAHTANKSNPHGVTYTQTGAAAAKHAAQHSASGTDPITPGMIGAMKIYSNLTELGLTESAATAATIVSAMADNSILLHPCSATATSAALAFPFNYGLLRVIKKNNSYADFSYCMVNQNYYGYYNGGASSNNWSGWNKFATTDYAVNKAGDTMTGGSLELLNGKGRLYVGANTAISNRSVAGDTKNERWFAVWSAAHSTHTAVKDALTLGDVVAGVVTQYNLFGEHNKPSGSYTGNGDATLRTIETGGIGSAILIRSTNGSAFVVNGAGWSISNGQIAIVTYATANFNNGVLTLATDHAALNANGVTYYYQVL